MEKPNLSSRGQFDYDLEMGSFDHVMDSPSLGLGWPKLEGVLGIPFQP